MFDEVKHRVQSPKNQALSRGPEIIALGELFQSFGMVYGGV